MGNIEIKGQAVNFNNPNQIMNMGGPWVGDLVIGATPVIDNVLIDNIIYYPEYNKLLFVRYNKISRWQKDNYFTINDLNTITNEVFMLKRKFKMVYIEGLIDINQLIIFNAFHNHDKTKKLTIKLEEEEYIQVL